MERKENRRKRLAAALLLGMALTMLFTGNVPDPGPGVPGFFGILYPEYCFSRVRECPKEAGVRERKLTFRWLRGL